MNIKNRIGNLVEIDWKNNLFDLQPENVKVSNNREYLKNTLLKYGFSSPFAVWKQKDKFYCIDGHTRKDVLLELQDEGVEVPEKLKGFEVIAKTKKEAIEILIEVFNQKHNPFSEPVFTEWLETENIDVEELDLESINVENYKFSEDYYSSKNKELNIDDFEDELVLKLKYNELDYNIVKGELSKIADNPEQALWKLIKGDEIKGRS